MTELCQFEVDILRDHRDGTLRPWGAAVGEALETLRDGGFLEGGFGRLRLTHKGLVELDKHPSPYAMTAKQLENLRVWVGDPGQRDKLRGSLGGDWDSAARIILELHAQAEQARHEAGELRDGARSDRWLIELRTYLDAELAGPDGSEQGDYCTGFREALLMVSAWCESRIGSKLTEDPTARDEGDSPVETPERDAALR